MRTSFNSISSQFLTILVGIYTIVALTCCSSYDDTITPTGTTGTTEGSVTIGNETSSGTPEGNTDTAYNEDDLIANSTFSSTVTITFGSTVTITNPLAAAGVTITESAGDVVINSSVAAVEYLLTGSTTNGSVKIYSDKKFKLTLNGVSITNNDGPAINIQSTKSAFVVLSNNTANTLTDGTTYATTDAEDMKGTFFSEGQLLFSGDGSLSVKGRYKHAICSDEYIRVLSGSIAVTAATSDGIHTNEAFIADGGTLNITSSNDGIQVEEGYVVINNGITTIHAGDKGISASYVTDNTIDPYITINGGTIAVTTTNGEGIESKSTLTINGGTITTQTPDDGMNAKKYLYINGGNIYAYSSSNDAIDSNGTLTVTGGVIIAAGTTGPEEGFDCDHNTFKITGGILIGVGGSTSSPTANVNTQPAVILGKGTANQLINIQSSDGTEALTFSIPRSYSTMLFSSAKLKSKTTYKVSFGGSVSGGTSVNGLYTSGTYSGGTSSTTFTTNSIVTQAGGSVGPG